MITIATIAFREFLEAFLLVSVFLGLDQKFHLRKRKEILFAALLGIFFSLLLPIIVFSLSSNAAKILTEKNADIMEGYLLTFSGFLIAYIVFSLHEFMKHDKKETLEKATSKVKREIFDLSLFFTITFFIIREGFEIVAITAITSLFSVFLQNIEGLLLGFVFASIIGIFTSLAYVRLPIKNIFRYTEYFIMLIGGAMVTNGISMLITSYTKVQLQNILPLPLHFLPNETTILGHVLKNITGIQTEMGILQAGMIIGYIVLVRNLLVQQD